LVEEDFLIENNQWELFLDTMEQELLKLNPEYKSKRESIRLGPPELRVLPEGTLHQKDAEIQKNRTGRHEQFKPSFLSNDLKFIEEFGNIVIS